MMDIHLNGETKTIPDGLHLLGLVEHLGLEPGWVVVEHNVVAVDRARWETTPVSAGDQVELVRFMGGG
jgi:sulfur carrier protein